MCVSLHVYVKCVNMHVKSAFVYVRMCLCQVRTDDCVSLYERQQTTTSDVNTDRYAHTHKGGAIHAYTRIFKVSARICTHVHARMLWSKHQKSQLRRRRPDAWEGEIVAATSGERNEKGWCEASAETGSIVFKNTAKRHYSTWWKCLKNDTDSEPTKM